MKRYTLIATQTPYLRPDLCCVFDWSTGKAVTMGAVNWRYINEEVL